MADTNFVQYTTAITASWCQDVNNFVYRGVIPTGTSFSNATFSGTSTFSGNVNVTGNATFTSLAASSPVSFSSGGTTTTPAIGDSSTNIASTSFVNSAINGQTAVTLTNTNVTLSATQYGQAIINLSGTLTGNVTVFFPASTGVWQVFNNTTGAFTVTLAVVGTPGLTYAIPQGQAQWVFSDSVNIRAGVSQTALTIQYPQPVRQTVQSAVISAQGAPAFIGLGSNLQPFMAASSVPVSMTFAAGFNSAGAVDLSCYLTADQFWPAVPANNQSFLYLNRTSATSATLGSTLAPPQYGLTYNQTAQSSLTLNNTILDDFGNTWTNTGVTFTNTSPMIAGTYMGVFNGSSYLKSTVFTSLYAAGNGGFTLRAKCKTTSLSTTQSLYFAVNGAGYGVAIQVNTAGKVLVALSSNGSSWDIANSVAGAATVATNTPIDVELDHDPVAGKYYIYVNGVLDQTITSSLKICAITQIVVGATGASTSFWNGNIQGFEFLPYCLHPNGASFTVPTTLPNVAAAGYASDWFNTQTYQMMQVSGPSTVAGQNPTLTAVNRLYVGECVTNSATVTSVTAYAYNGKYDSGLFSVVANTTYSKTHNLGTTQFNVDVTLSDDVAGTNERPATPVFYNSTNSTYYGWYGGTSNRSSFAVNTAGQVGLVTTSIGGQASGYYRIRVRRAF